ncbi:hypothetical protein GGC63_003947 [Paenibacillus sp. OAS669]|nr:hypothetical protein [Paenibacillus sp. OAS669]
MITMQTYHVLVVDDESEIRDATNNCPRGPLSEGGAK